MKKALIIFVKNPEPGKVKTRIAQTMGNEKAVAIYQQLLLHTKKETQLLDCDKFIFYADHIVTNDLWPTSVFHKRTQQGNGLGERMFHAFDELCKAGYEQVLIIGSDCMELNSSVIAEGFQQLNTNELVIGPTCDGGYYLLGMRWLIPALFNNKPWSTDQVFAETIADASKIGLRYFLLPTLSDIDTETDWNHYLQTQND